MKSILFVAAIAAATFAMPAAAANVGVSVSVGEPGFYGTIDIGNAPPPVLYSPQPVLVEPVPTGIAPLPPIYLRVPPGHRKDWMHHCAEYNACGRQVYFVQDKWYKNVYAPHYQQHHDYYQGRRDFEDKRESERHEERGHERHDGHEGHDR